MVPNGPPQSFGLLSAATAPLFTPEQVAQATDPRQFSSLMPMTRESTMNGGEFPRLPGFLHGFFPGFEHFQEVRRSELEWRSHMESMVEQLGLQLRASHNENVRLRNELLEARKESSRYGTPEEDHFSEKGGIQKHVPNRGSQSKEDGVVAGQDQGISFGNASNKKKPKEEGVVTRKESLHEEGTRVRQASQIPSSGEEQSDQSQSQSEEDQGKEDGPAGRQQPGSPKEGHTMQVLLKIVDAEANLGGSRRSKR